MKTKSALCGFAVIAFLGFVFLLCQSPQDPRTKPENAKIISFKTDFKDSATVPVFNPPVFFYKCTINVQLPELIDSAIVKDRRNDAVVFATMVGITDSQCTFIWRPSTYGKDTLVAYIVKKQNAGNDTILKPYFSPSLYIKSENNCVLNTACADWFDTIWADTCAYGRDSVAYPADIGSGLSWQGDTIRGKTYRLVRVYGTHCIIIGGIPRCFPYWMRKWTVEYNDALMHVCTQTGLDTLMWTVANSLGDTVTAPLVLKRSATCP